MDEFQFRPTYSVPLNRQPKMREAPFGDGYVQRSPMGINHNPESWALTFAKMHLIRAMEIREFLEEHDDGSPFQWMTMWGELKTFYCPQWSFTFEEEDAITIVMRIDQYFG